MKSISVDIESFSSANLAKSGMYRYSEAEDFEILLFGYSIDGGKVRVVDLARGERIPREIIEALTDPGVVKWAFNAAFERICLSRYLGLPTGTYLDPASWRCTMVWSAYMGLPLSLMGVGTVLKLEKKKLAAGKDLIRYFCTPCAPTITNGKRTRNHPSHAPDKWRLFVEYNKRDVEVELGIHKRLSTYPVPDAIWDEYHLDQRINDRGVLIDRGLVRSAIDMDRTSRQELMARMKAITDLENPNSVSQVKTWLADNGLEVDSLGKKDVIAALTDAPHEIREVLELRLQLAKSSIKKYQAMENAACSDDRARGMFQFYGASRTGRWSGRQIQAQNLKRNSIEDLAVARTLVKGGDYEAVKLLYGNVPDTLSQLVRTAFIPRKGYRFIVSDFSAIEARVLSWLAGETWRMDIFAEDGDIYCATASRMFHCEVTKHGENGHLRQKGKQAELACIAEGQLVLTDRGLVPIEHVTIDHLLWDGEDWVTHEGVIYKGRGKVITYGGLTATADHLVWIEGIGKPVQLGFAAKCGSHLVSTADGEKAIVFGSHQGKRKAHDSNDALKELGSSKVYDILNAGEHHRFTVSGILVHNCGYGGSVGALTAMGALDMGLKEDELKPLVDAWRQSNPNIVQLWWDVDKAALDAVRKGITTEMHNLTFSYEGNGLFITLPSGRKLAYVRPKIETNDFGSDCITYEGTGSTKKWERIGTYGPKLVENCLAHGTLVLTERGFVPIQEIQMQDRVWDGVEWVSHEGLIDKGIQETVRIGQALEMTANHKILTTKGWRECATTEGFEWADVQLPGGYQQCKDSDEDAMRILVHPESCKKQVYDLANCGPRHRFAVWDGGAGKARLVSNCTQAISRDLLCHAMQQLEAAGCRIVMHIHDEVVIEAPKDMDVQDICRRMSSTPPWAEDLHLNADGYETDFYKKD